MGYSESGSLLGESSLGQLSGSGSIGSRSSSSKSSTTGSASHTPLLTRHHATRSSTGSISKQQQLTHPEARLGGLTMGHTTEGMRRLDDGVSWILASLHSKSTHFAYTCPSFASNVRMGGQQEFHDKQEIDAVLPVLLMAQYVSSSQ